MSIYLWDDETYVLRSNMKRNSTLTLIVMLVIVPFGVQNLVNRGVGLETGTINGIEYSHGWVEFTDTGEFSHIEQGSVEEAYSEHYIVNRTVPLLTDFALNDIIYRLDGVFYEGDTNGTYELWMNNETLMAYLDNIFTHPGLFTVTEAIENYSLEMATVVSSSGEFLGQFPLNTTFLAYEDLLLSKLHEIVITPVLVVVDVTVVETLVTVNKTRMAMSYLGYYSEYAMEYDVSGFAYQVQVTDNENFGFQALMFDNVTANYKEMGVFAFGYYFMAADIYELKYADTGDPVPWEMYPKHMLPVTAEASGLVLDTSYSEVDLTAVTTFQSIMAAFVSRSTNETVQHAKMAVWATQKATTMLAYEDTNENGMFDLAWTNEGILPDDGDILTHVGFGEAYHIEQIQARRHSHEFNQSLNLWGYGMNFTQHNVNNTFQYVDYNVYDFGDVSAPRTTTPIWEDPVAQADGSVLFEFGMDYEDFPVTWISVTDGSACVDPEHIAYRYHLVVDPDEGIAKVSPTFTFGGITDAGLKEDVSGSSLAFPILVEFLAVEALHSVTQTQTDVNATRTVAGKFFSVENGLGDSFVEIELPDEKKVYSAGGEEYNASLSALTLVVVKGGAFMETVVPLGSQTQGVTGTATLNAEREVHAVAFMYRADLVIVSYPTWGGEEIIHDPDYDLSFEPRAQPTTSTTTSSTSEEETTSSITPGTTTTTPVGTTSADDDGDGDDTPGFGLLLTLTSLLTGVIVINRSRKKH